jgi:cell division septation protein DedD
MMRVVDGRGVRKRLIGAATAAVAIMMIVTGCDPGPQQPSGPPQSTPQPAIATAPQGHAFYAQVASYDFHGSDTFARARQLAQALRAKGFPAAVYLSHSEFPSHTYPPFVAVSSGQFPAVQQAQAQVERLHRAGFTDAKVFEVYLPK